MTRRLFFSILLCFGLAACTPKHEEVPLYTYDTVILAYQSALLHAIDLNGKSPPGQLQKGLYAVADTHSMEPVLWGGDYIVVDQSGRRPYAGLKVGEVVTYHANWQPADAAPVTHRLALKDKDGWILSGDNNAHYESHWRMTEKEYIGTVAAIYRVKP